MGKEAGRLYSPLKSVTCSIHHTLVIAWQSQILRDTVIYHHWSKTKLIQKHTPTQCQCDRYIFCVTRTPSWKISDLLLVAPTELGQTKNFNFTYCMWYIKPLCLSSSSRWSIGAPLSCNINVWVKLCSDVYIILWHVKCISLFGHVTGPMHTVCILYQKWRDTNEQSIIQSVPSTCS